MTTHNGCVFIFTHPFWTWKVTCCDFCAQHVSFTTNTCWTRKDWCLFLLGTFPSPTNACWIRKDTNTGAFSCLAPFPASLMHAEHKKTSALVSFCAWCLSYIHDACRAQTHTTSVCFHAWRIYCTLWSTPSMRTHLFSYSVPFPHFKSGLPSPLSLFSMKNGLPLRWIFIYY